MRYARRRKRRMAAAEHDLTNAQWEALKEAWGGCAYCGTAGGQLQKDCMQPISRGGRYTLTNVVPSCASCNASKCNSEVTTWMRRKKLDERTFLVSQASISRRIEMQGPATPPTAADQMPGHQFALEPPPR
jgi:5-methylcytosine-specific restriction endonuclease McrA